MTSLVEIYRHFPTKEAAVAHLEQVRWPDGPTCPQCGANTVSRKSEKGQADRLQCWSCERSFSATVGTIFHNSHIDLQRWFLLIALMLNAKKGLSAMQAARSVAYVDWDMFAEQYGPTHTNTTEGFWSIVKRAIHGQFHHVSVKYLPLYLRELAYRYNGRHDSVGLDGVLHLAVKP